MRALLLIDIQNDFCEGGALAVPQGSTVVPVANALIERFRAAGEPIIATRDWHPADHRSFAVNNPDCKVGDTVDLNGTDQYLWPVHCVGGSLGAQLREDLSVREGDIIIDKGCNPEVDSYSAFFDNDHRSRTGLAEVLSELGVDSLVVCGLATDYCVKYSCMDALELGFHVTLVATGCRAIDVVAGDGLRTLQELEAAGATVVSDSCDI